MDQYDRSDEEVERDNQEWRDADRRMEEKRDRDLENFAASRYGTVDGFDCPQMADDQHCGECADPAKGPRGFALMIVCAAAILLAAAFIWWALK